MKHYAPCLWKPHILKPPKEVTHVLDALQVRSKKIKRIDFIGIAKNMEQLDRELYGKMRDAGIPPDEMNSWKYRDSIRIPCKAVLCEPVVFTFEDDTAVAMMPSYEGSLKLSINKVNANTTGLNHRNAVASKLFQPLIGKYLDEVSVFHTTVKEHKKRDHTDDEAYTIQFHAKDKHGYADCGIEFSYRYSGWYTVSLTDQHWHTYRCNAIQDVEYADIRKARMGDRSIPRPLTLKNIWILHNETCRLSLSNPYGEILVMD